MLKKVYRLKKNEDYRKVISQGQGLSNSDYKVFYRKSHAVKIGVTISGKVANAVKRNKAKRQIHSFLRTWIKDYLKGNLEIVIIVKENYLKNTYQANMDSLKRLFAKLEVNNED